MMDFALRGIEADCCPKQADTFCSDLNFDV
jgi:hypothetical protein